jgi:hypothetical protein
MTGESRRCAQLVHAINASRAGDNPQANYPRIKARQSDGLKLRTGCGIEAGEETQIVAPGPELWKNPYRRLIPAIHRHPLLSTTFKTLL